MAKDPQDPTTPEGSWSPRRGGRKGAGGEDEGAAAVPAGDGKGGKAGKGKEPAKDPAALASDIERTREELAETLDAIADKVSPKRVATRTRKKVADTVRNGAGDAVAAVKDAAGSARESVKDAAGSAKESVEDAAAAAKDTATSPLPDSTVSLPGAEVPLEPAPLPADSAGALADAAVTATEPPGAETPGYASYAPAPSSSSKVPLVAGVGALVAVLLLLRRRRGRRR